MDKEFDLNELFSLQYNFDKLKVLLGNILTKQNETEKKIKNQDSIIHNLFNKQYNSHKSDNNLIEKLNNFKIEKIKEKEKIKTLSSSTLNNQNQNNINSIESSNNKITVKNNIIESQNKNDYSESKNDFNVDNYNKLFDEINARLKKIEDNHNLFDKSLKEIKKNQDNFKSENNDLKSNIHDIFENIENMNIKISGLNIYDALKNIKSNDGNIDINKTLIESLEKKVFQKFSFVDNKIKSNESEIFSVKNDIFNTKNNIEKINENIELFEKESLNQKEEINKIKQEIELNIKEKVNTKVKNLEEEIKKLKNEINNNLSNTNIKDTENENENIKTENEKIDSYNKMHQKIQSLYKKIENITEIEIQKINDKIENIIKELKMFINIDIFQKEKDRLSQLIGKCNNLSDEFEIVKTNVNQNTNSIRIFTNTLEKLNSQIIEGKENYFNSTSEKKLKKINKDLSENYLDNKTFNSFISIYKKDMEKIKKEHDDIQKIFNDVYETFKTKVDINEHKNSKEYLTNIIEELNNKLENKYFEKFEINKIIRNIQNQIKLIIESIPKEKEKNNLTSNNWLLANKPLGFYCASCESYIGDISGENSMFYSKNNNPLNLKENMTGYRIGNGFSRILSRLKIGEQKKMKIIIIIIIIKLIISLRIKLFFLMVKKGNLLLWKMKF